MSRPRIYRSISQCVFRISPGRAFLRTFLGTIRSSADATCLPALLLYSPISTSTNTAGFIRIQRCDSIISYRLATRFFSCNNSQIASPQWRDTPEKPRKGSGILNRTSKEWKVVHLHHDENTLFHELVQRTAYDAFSLATQALES